MQNTIRRASAALFVGALLIALGGPALGAADGLLGSYYNNVDLSGTPVLERVDPTVNFNWDHGSPDGAVSTDNFSIRWTGKVRAEFSEEYTISTLTDDGARLWVGGVQLVNQWIPQGGVEHGGTIVLVAGRKYDIVFEFYEATDGARAELYWACASQGHEIIPTEFLYSSTIITEDPTDQRVAEGQQASFSVTIAGVTGTPSFQWYENGGAISGATNPLYTTPPTTMLDNGDLFSCVVTDGTGTYDSSVALLTVTGLVAQYAFENAGDVGHDDTGNGNDGTPQNGASHTATAKLGTGGLSLVSASSQYVNCGTRTDFLVGTGNFAVSAWINTTSTATMTVFACGGTGAGGKRFRLLLVNGQARFEMDDNSGEVVATSSTTYNTGTWQQIVGMRNGQTISVYANGNASPVASMPIPTLYGSVNSARPALIGAVIDAGTGNPVEFFNGTLDEVRVYNRALSTVEIQGLYDPRPTVSITSPANGASFTVGSNVDISANAADTAPGSVTQVEFFRDSTSIQVDPTAPYQATFSAAPQGKYVLTAVATDNGSGTTQSSPVTIVVGTVVSISPAVAAGEPSTTGVFNITREGITTGTTTVNYAFNAGSSTAASGADFTLNPPGSVVFNAGETVKTVQVLVVDDTEVEGVETVVVTIGTVTGGAASSASSAMVTIADNDGDPNLIAWWELDEPGGGLAYDSAGFNTGSNNGATLDQTGEFGGAYGFNGSSSYVQVPSSAAMANAVNGDCTISVWAKSGLAAIGYPEMGFVLDYGSALTSGVGIMFLGNNAIGSNGHIVAYYNGVGIGGTPGDAGRWYHIALVHSGFDLKLYVDGELDSSATNVAAFQPNTYDLRLGAQAKSLSRYFAGSIDDVRIYNRALSASEISDIYKLADPSVETVTVSAASGVEAGTSVSITVEALNDEEGLTGTVRIAGPGGYVLIGTLVEQTPGTYAYAWDTGGCAPGSYDINVTLSDASGHTDENGVDAAVPDAVVTLVDTNSPSIASITGYVGAVPATQIEEGLNVRIVVRETGGESGLSGTIEITGPNSYDTGLLALTWDSVAADGSYVYTWNTVGLTAGTYTVQATLRDGDVPANSAVGSTTLEILQDTTAPVIESIQARVGTDTTGPFVIGSPVTIIVTAVNDEPGLTGTVSIDRAGVGVATLDLIDQGDGTYTCLWLTAGQQANLNYHAVATLTDQSGDGTDTLTFGLTASGLPYPWQAADVGTVGTPGGATYAANVYALTGSGTEFGLSSESFFYLWQPLSGNCTFTAKMITAPAGTGSYPKAGIMIRDNLSAGHDPSAKFVSLLGSTAASDALEMIYRTSWAAPALTVQDTQQVPQWMRVVRNFDTFTAYKSSDGVNWVQVGTVSLTMAETVYVGLAISSAAASTVTAQFSDVSVRPMPWPWKTADVGAVGVVGTTDYDQIVDRFVVNGGGSDIGTIDSFRFTYQNAGGDCSIVTRVASQENTSAWALSGVMFRANPNGLLEANTRHVTLAVTPSNGIQLLARKIVGGSTGSEGGITGAAPRWLKLTRSGSSFTGYVSQDGIAWSSVGSAVTLGIEAPMHAGTVVCAGVLPPTVLNETVFGSSTLSRATTLPPPYLFSDVGNVVRGGSASYSAASDSITITSAGNLYDVSDKVGYCYRTLSGNFEMVVRVKSLTAATLASKAGIMCREDPYGESKPRAGSKFYALAVTSGNGIRTFYRTGTDGIVTANTGASGEIPVYLKLSRTNNSFTASYASDGLAWVDIGTQTLSMSGPVLVGYFAASGSNQAISTAEFDSRQDVVGDVLPPSVADVVNSGTSEAGSDITITVLEAGLEVGLEGTVTITDGGSYTIVGTLVDNGNGAYTYTWDTDGLLIGSYQVNAYLSDAWGNADPDGVDGRSPDSTITLVNATAPVVNRVTSEVNGTSANQYFQGDTVVINVYSAGEAKPGLLGEYYDDPDLSQPVGTRIDSTINFGFTNPPIPGMTDDESFSVRWTGFIYTPAGGAFNFYCKCDQGFRLWIDGGLPALDYWAGSDGTEYSTSMTLDDSMWYPIRLEFYENSGPQEAILSWDYPGQAKQVVPAASFGRDAYEDGLTGTIAVTGPSYNQTFDLVPMGEGRYIYNWDSSGRAGGTYEFNAVLTDANGAQDLDGAPPTPDHSFILVDNNLPEIQSVDSTADGSSNEMYRIGQQVTITVTEANLDPDLKVSPAGAPVCEVLIQSTSPAYSSTIPLVNNSDGTYSCTWNTGGLTAGSNYEVRTRLVDATDNQDDHTGAVNPDLLISLRLNDDFYFTGGVCTIEAEHFHTTARGADSVQWRTEHGIAGYLGHGYVLTQDGTAAADATWSGGCDLTYQIDASAVAGQDIYIAIRRIAPDADSDTVRAGYGTAEVAAVGTFGGTTPPSTWQWMRGTAALLTGAPASFNLNIRRLEDGMLIDRIVLATSLAALPANGSTIEGNAETIDDGLAPVVGTVSSYVEADSDGTYTDGASVTILVSEAFGETGLDGKVRVTRDRGAVNVNFGSVAITDYSGQTGGTYQVQDGGATLQMDGGLWKKAALPYTVTGDTVLEFDYSCATEGNLHAIGLDDDDEYDDDTPPRLFKVNGTLGAGTFYVSDYDTYTGSTWTHYVIPIGALHYTGAMNYLTFVNTDVPPLATASCAYRNVTLHEGISADYTTAPTDLTLSDQGNGLYAAVWDTSAAGIDPVMGYQVNCIQLVDAGNNQDTDGSPADPDHTINLTDIFREKNGTCVMEAEHYTRLKRNADTLQWTLGHAQSGYSDRGYMYTVDNSGSPDGTWGGATELVYHVQITTAGDYYMAIRRRSPIASSDSVWPGLDNNQGNIGTFDGIVTQWQWKRGSAALGNLAAGLHTIHLRRHEDGMQIDRLMISTDVNNLPADGSTAIGPTEAEYLVDKEPAVIEQISSSVAGNTSGTYALGSVVRITVTEANRETGLTGYVEIPDAAAGGGQALVEFWTNWWVSIDELRNHASFPDNPNDSMYSDTFEGRREWADNYCTRIRAVLVPPADGDYTFWVSHDDGMKLWLSSDMFAANAVEIYSSDGWRPFDDWLQIPGTHPLVGGRKYYCEAMQREGGGGDHVRVGWTNTSGLDNKPIQSTHMAPPVWQVRELIDAGNGTYYYDWDTQGLSEGSYTNINAVLIDGGFVIRDDALSISVYLGDLTPPVVVQTGPHDGDTEVSRWVVDDSGDLAYHAIRIDFNKAMDTTFFGTWSISPTVPLVTPSWADADTLLLDLGQQLDSSTVYTVSLQGQRDDPAHNILDGNGNGAPGGTYNFSFTTAGPPRVVNATPPADTGDGDVATGTPVVLTFSTNMDIQSTQAAFSLEDSASNTVSGTFSVSVTPNKFVGQDWGTRGSWKGVYGSDGYVIPGDASSPPAYMAYNTNGTVHSWVNLTSDVRALEKAATTERIASCWYNDTTSLRFELNATDGLAHQVSLYFLDWDTTTRRQTIQLRDHAFGAVLDTVALDTSFNQGVWVTFVVQGYVDVTITCTAGTNAILTGVFFDPVNGGRTLTFTPGSPYLEGETYTVTLTGAALDFLGRGLDGNADGSSDGAGVDDFTYSFTGGTRPVVVSTVPVSGAQNVDFGASIEVTFSEPMDPLTTRVAFTLWDQSSFPQFGTMTWFDGGTRLEFRPAVQLVGNQTYRVTITSTATDVAGNRLSAHSWSFTTARDDTLPVVIESATVPSPIGGTAHADTVIQVTFSERMNTAETEDAIELVRTSAPTVPVLGATSWLNNDTTLVFTPNQDLLLDTSYTVTVYAAGSSHVAVDLSGNPVDGGDTGPLPWHNGSHDGALDNYTWSFTVEATPTYRYTIRTVPEGLDVTVTDAGNNVIPQEPVYYWTEGARYTLSAQGAQYGGIGSRYLFAGWAIDDPATTLASNENNPISLTVGTDEATYTALFLTQYELVATAVPPSAGSVAPLSEYYDAYASGVVTALARPGYTFAGWGGDITATTNPGIVTMDGPKQAVAYFISSTGNWALHFNGPDCFLDLGDVDGITADMTVEGWFYPEWTGNIGIQPVVSGRISTGFTGSYGVFFGFNGATYVLSGGVNLTSITDDDIRNNAYATTTATASPVGIGQASFTVGGTMVTGSDFQTKGILPGDLIRLDGDGQWHLVASVQSQTQLTLAAPFASVIYGGTGTVRREYWLGIIGNNVSDLTSNGSYPDSPSGSDEPNIFEAPTDWADNYGQKMSGYVQAPMSGDYIFWISSDDLSELYLSTDQNPGNVSLIAWENSWSGARSWEEGDEKSNPQTLVAGAFYYIEALQKEGGGGDNLAVGWQLPDGTQERPIPSNRITTVIPLPAIGSASFMRIDCTFNQWHHFALVKRGAAGNDLRLFLDGSLKSTVPASGNVSTYQSGTLPVTIGHRSQTNNAREFVGIVDEVRISNASNLYSAPFTRPQRLDATASTLALWHMDEGAGYTTAEVSGNGSEGVLSGTGQDTPPTWVKNTFLQSPRVAVLLNAVDRNLNPIAGLQLVIDGTICTTTATALTRDWVAGTLHTIGVRSDIQTLGVPGERYNFTRWNDGDLTEIRSIIVGSSNTTYTAEFARQYQVNVAVTPPGGGSVVPISGDWINSGNVTFTATAASSYTFAQWSGDLTGSTAATTLNVTEPPFVTAQFTASGTTSSLSVSATVLGTGALVPGRPIVFGTVPYAVPVSLSPAPGSYTLEPVEYLTIFSGERYRFLYWADDNPDSPQIPRIRPITVPDMTTYEAVYRHEYRFTAQVTPAGAGVVDPGNGSWLQAGSTVSVSAYAASGYQFTGWSGALLGTGTQSLLMNAAKTVVASFTTVPIVYSAYPDRGPSSGGTFVTVNGYGFQAGATVYFVTDYDPLSGPPALTDRAVGVNVISAQKLTCTNVGHAAGIVDIVVVNADGGLGIGADLFMYQPPISLTGSQRFRISEHSPTDVRIEGQGFLPGISIAYARLHGTSTELSAVGDNVDPGNPNIWIATFDLAGGVYDLIVSNGADADVLLSALTVVGTPIINDIDPDVGPESGNLTVTIQGANFDGPRTLTGTLTFITNRTQVLGSGGTQLLLEVSDGDFIRPNGTTTWLSVMEVVSDTELTLDQAFASTSFTGAVQIRGSTTASVGTSELSNLQVSSQGTTITGAIGPGAAVDGQIAGWATGAGPSGPLTIRVRNGSQSIDVVYSQISVGSSLRLTTEDNLPPGTVATLPWWWDYTGSYTIGGLATPAYAGLIVNSRVDLADATFESVKFFAQNGSPTASLPNTGTPVGYTGSGAFDNSVANRYAITNAGGMFLSEQTDQFYFVHMAGSSVYTMVANLTYQEHTNDYAKAGLMFRSGLEGAIPYAAMVLSPNRQARFQHRTANDVNSVDSLLTSPLIDKPGWIRLKRNASNSFEGSKFEDTGEDYEASVAVAGGTEPYVWTVVGGSLPPGLTLATSWGNEGVITGRLTTAGLYTFTVRVVDSSEPQLSGEGTYSISVRSDTEALEIHGGTAFEIPKAVAGAEYLYTFNASGGIPGYTWSAASLPPMFEIDSYSGDIYNVIPPTAGTYTFTVTATDSGGVTEVTQQHTASASVTLEVLGQSLVVLTTELDPAPLNAPYRFQIEAVGGSTQLPTTFSLINGELPPGLYLNADLADVTVTSLDLSSTLYDRFTYVKDINILRVTPASGIWTGGTTVVVEGQQFNATGARVYFGNIEAASYTSRTGTTSITCVTPRHMPPGPVDVRVVNPSAGVGILPLGFTFTGPSQPQLFYADPDKGAIEGGTAITIYGDNFLWTPTLKPDVYFGKPLSGEATFIPGNMLVSGDASTVFTTEVESNDYICLSTDGAWVRVASVQDDQQLTLAADYPLTLPGGTGTTFVGAQAPPAQVAVVFDARPLTGTLTFNATTAVGGQGSAFLSQVFPGDFIKPTGGVWSKVASVASNTALTLTAPYAGTPASATTGQVSYDDTITLVTPASYNDELGPVDVFISNPPEGLYAHGIDVFTYLEHGCTVSDVVPSIGPESGGTTVTITGIGFATGAEAPVVTFGVADALSVVVTSSTTLTCTAPSGLGNAVVSVQNPNAVPGTWSGVFRYMGSPQITDVIPNTGPTGGGTAVTIHGSNFWRDDDWLILYGLDLRVLFDGIPASFDAAQITDTQMIVTAPASVPADSMGYVSITVINPDGTSGTMGSAFEYVGPPVGVTSVSPSSGPTGTVVTITGTNFVATPTVFFGPTSAGGGNVTVVSDTRLEVVVPSGTGLVNVTVVNPDGQSAMLVNAFGYAPRVTGVRPPQYTVGFAPTQTFIDGAGFDEVGGVTVFIGSQEATVTSVTNAVIQVALPVSATPGPVNVTVTNDASGASNTLTNGFEYLPALELFGVGPPVGAVAGGTVVTITGEGIASNATVRFGTTAATVLNYVSSSEVRVLAPAHAAGTVDVTVSQTNPTQTDTLTASFLYIDAVSLTGVSPAFGPVAGGNTVTLSGGGFVAAPTDRKVFFGTQQSASVTYVSGTQLTAIVPASVTGEDIVDIRVEQTVAGATMQAEITNSYEYFDPVTVTNVSPTSGRVGGGQTVAITGAGFVGSVRVLFGGAACPSVTVVNATQMNVVTPPHAAGAVDVVVVKGTRSATAAGAFTYYRPMVAYYPLSPSHALQNTATPVTIRGENFLSGAEVQFGASAWLVPSAVTATTITVNTPNNIAASTVDVSIRQNGGAESITLSNAFTFVPALALTSITPAEGSSAGGDWVIVSGQGFTPDTTVTFNAAQGTVTFVSTTELHVETPPGTHNTTVNVTVDNPYSAPATLTSAFSYNNVPTLAITMVRPATGSTAGGTTVTVYGVGFASDATVAFAGIGVAPTSVSSSEIVVRTPAHAAGAVTVQVTQGPSDVASLANGFEYVAAPLTIAGLSPTGDTTAGGTQVVITGTGIQNGATVSFGGTPLPASAVTWVSATRLTVVAPPHAPGAVDVTVSQTGPPAQEVTLSNTFTYAAAMHAFSITPMSGAAAGGTPVTITGEGFTAPAMVMFGSVPGTGLSVVNATTITVTAPAHAAGSVDIDVSTFTPSQTSTLVGAFEFIPNLTVSGIDPDNGSAAGGSIVTIYGQGFSSTGMSVTFGGTAATGVSYLSSSELRATTPVQTPGFVNVVVTRTSPAATSTLANGYEYTSLSPQIGPEMASVAPNHGPTSGGTTITITGTDLDMASRVLINNQECTIVSQTATQIRATTANVMSVFAMTNGGTYPIQLEVDLGGVTGLYTGPGVTFEYVPRPNITGLDHTVYFAGGTINIYGSHFRPTATVEFGPPVGQVLAIDGVTVILHDSTRIEMVVPYSDAYGTQIEVTVNNHDDPENFWEQSDTYGDTSDEDGFTYTLPPAQIDRLGPESDSVSSWDYLEPATHRTIRIYSRLVELAPGEFIYTFGEGTTTVYFYDVEASVVDWSHAQTEGYIVVEVPDAPPTEDEGPAPLTVSNLTGQQTTSALFTYVNEPVRTCVIVTPVDGSHVYGAAITINAEATDDRGIARMEFFYKLSTATSFTLAGQDATWPYTYSWNTTQAIDGGTYVWIAKAWDTTGRAVNARVSSEIRVIVDSSDPDNPPVVSMVAPAPDGRTVGGSSVLLAANVTDDGTVEWVRFFVDGVQVAQVNSTNHPAGFWTYIWSAETVSAGVHNITVQASDGTTIGVGGVSVVVDNSPSAPLGINSILTAAGQNWCNLAGGVEVRVRGTGFVADLTTLTFWGVPATIVPGSFVEGTTDEFLAIVPRCPTAYGEGPATIRIAVGATFADYTTGLWWYEDAAPICAWYGPASGTTVNDGEFRLQANAVDDRAVITVVFQWNDAGTWTDLGAADTTWPYEYVGWAPGPGTYDVRAVAADIGLQSGSSQVITLTVVNDGSANDIPIVTITWPYNGARLWGNPLGMTASVNDPDAATDPAVEFVVMDANRFDYTYASVALGNMTAATLEPDAVTANLWSMASDWDTTDMATGSFYRILAIVTDDQGAVAYAGVQITYAPPLPEPGDDDPCGGGGGGCGSPGGGPLLSWLIFAGALLYVSGMRVMKRARW